ncbi:MAG: Peptide chain release factor subunit 1 [Parcubacteria group bacterium GW2011_GWA1_36_12]|nr:MAG: Peptide chain release factor subunit 1 [Parcubacteria group bacterium GW2011_GWA1_36_12]
MNDKQKAQLEEQIEELEAVRGRHTELVTVLIPVDFNIHSVTKQLEAERSTADNIKSKQTRSAVTDAIDMIVRTLKGTKQTPANGLALYAGNVSEKEGVSDIKLWAIEPPKPLRVRMYRCDQTFVTEPLREMLQTDEVYGLVAIDRQEATIGLLEGKQIKVLRKLTSGVPSKVRAGGQSAARFARITEGLAKEFFRRTAEAMKELFFDLPRLKGILVGGPIPTKDEFLEDGQIVTKLKEKVIAVKDIGYVDEHGLKLLVEASKDDIAEQEIIKEKKIIEEFFMTLGKYPEKAAYGFEQTKRALERGAVYKLLISSKLPKHEIAEFEQLAINIGSEIIIISGETQEGDQFFNITKGVGAILRFQIE